MANSLKVKMAIAGVAVLVLIPLLQTKFFAPVTIKRWGKVSWDDFQGIPQPFSSYEAGISSSIYLEYDSSKGRYVAYAGQNNVQSWARRSQQEQDYLLNHEQYHFNITQLHAQKLNDYIEKNPEGSLRLFHLRRGSINIDLGRMQRRYDEETDHSLKYDRQRRWEYEIDSLMTLSKGWVTDYFSGGRVYFPDTPDTTKGFTDDHAGYRGYYLKKYGMQFALFSFHTGELDVDALSDAAYSYDAKNGRVTRYFAIDSALYDFEGLSISNDTSGYTYYSKWVYANPYLYKVDSWYPNDTGDTTGYAKNALSFINSFQVVNTDEYWITKLEASDSPIVVSTVSKRDRKTEKIGSQYCVQIGSPRPLGFYRGPFFRDDGSLFVAYDYLVHPHALHDHDVMLLNTDWYWHTPTPEGQIYFVPAKNIPGTGCSLKFGYILLEDSAKNCYEFYHESLDITPAINTSGNDVL